MTNLEHLVENGLVALENGRNYNEWLEQMKKDINWNCCERLTIDDLWEICQYVFYVWTADRKTEPTISKMEQVDKDINVRSKDKPQIQLTARCLNCNNAKACKEKHWEGCVYEPKDEKTCETCRHWKYIAHEWQCEACKCQGYEPKDGSKTQTETQNSNLTFEKADEPQPQSLLEAYFKMMNEQTKREGE